MEGPKVHIVYTRVPGFISSSYTPLHAPLCNQVAKQNQWMVNQGSHSGHFLTLKRQRVIATVMVHTIIHEKCLNRRQPIHHFYMFSDYPYVDFLHNTFDDIWRAGFDETSVSNVMLVTIIHSTVWSVTAEWRLVLLGVAYGGWPPPVLPSPSFIRSLAKCFKQINLRNNS